MSRHLSFAAILTSVPMVVLPASGHPAQAAMWWPVPGPVVREFDPPEPDWLPGHRGVDLAAAPGATVRTPRDGVIAFAGRVAGSPVLVVGHGAVRATYQPVEAGATVGSTVRAGQPIGQIVSGAAHCTPTCLHWGALVGDRYVDPRILLGRAHVVLLPTAD